jgi:hypothetical protein
MTDEAVADDAGADDDALGASWKFTHIDPRLLRPTALVRRGTDDFGSISAQYQTEKVGP